MEPELELAMGTTGQVAQLDWPQIFGQAAGEEGGIGAAANGNCNAAVGQRGSGSAGSRVQGSREKAKAAYINQG